MAVRTIHMGSARNIHVYDDVAFPNGLETDGPVQTSYVPAVPNDVLRLSDLLNLSWPVGSVFLSVVATNPSVLLGGGTWVRIAEGQMLVGFKAADVDFGVVEGTGGAKTNNIAHTHTGPNHTHTTPDHTLTLNETPAHTHQVDGNLDAAAGAVARGLAAAGAGADNVNTDSKGGGAAHNHGVTGLGGAAATGGMTGDSTPSILNPYFTVYIWKRTV